MKEAKPKDATRPTAACLMRIGCSISAAHSRGRKTKKPSAKLARSNRAGSVEGRSSTFSTTESWGASQMATRVVEEAQVLVPKPSHIARTKLENASAKLLTRVHPGRSSGLGHLSHQPSHPEIVGTVVQTMRKYKVHHSGASAADFHRLPM